MSIASAIPGRTSEQDLARRRPFTMVGIAIWLSLLLVLSYLGYHGRQQAMLQARLEEMAPIRDQIQEILDNDGVATQQLLARLRGASADSTWPPATQQLRAAADSLRALVGRFEADYSMSRLLDAQSREYRLSQATLANAERRFTDAMTAISLKDEQAEQSGSAGPENRLLRVLRVRADSFYGLNKWVEAAECYRRLLALQPHRTISQARLAESEAALGKREEAVAVCSDLAKSHNFLGNASLIEGKTEAAVAHYQSALNLQSWLVEHSSDLELERGLAATEYNLGCAFLLQERPDLGSAQFQKALEIETPLAERLKDDKLRHDLALTQFHLANAFLGQQKLDAALQYYDKAIAIQSQLLGPARDADLAKDFGVCHNNRGVVLRAAGKLDQAVSGYQKAIEILTQALDASPNPSPLFGGPNDPRVRLDFVVELTEQNLEISSHARMRKSAQSKEIAVALATALQNLGYANLVLGKPAPALENFKLAAQVYSRLVERDGHTDFRTDFGQCLSPIAWIYATSSDPNVRDALKAKEVALKACSLTDWQASQPLKSLAAACAESGNFADAVKWQQKAIELAPDNLKPGLLYGMDYYKAGKPFHERH